MRKSTAIITSIVAASALAVSLRVGDIATLDNIAVDFSGPSTSGGSTPTPDPTQAPTQSPTATPGNATASPKPSSVPAPAPKKVTVDSDVIQYKYGAVQISITKVGSEITAVNLLQGDETNGRARAYQILIDATLQVQGTDFGNVSGATFTADAFRKAVDSALLKF